MIYLFNHSLKVWSRILAYEAGMMTELRLTPVNPRLDWTWEHMVNPIDIRHSPGHISTRDRVVRALPEYVRKVILTRLGEELGMMLIEGDVLSLVDWPRYQEMARRGEPLGRLLVRDGGLLQLIAFAACRESGHTYPPVVPILLSLVPRSCGPSPKARVDECERCHTVRTIRADGSRWYSYPLVTPKKLPDTCCALVEPRRNWCASCTDNDGDPNFCSNVDREEER